LTASKHVDNVVAILKQPDPVDHGSSDQSMWWLNKDGPVGFKTSTQPWNIWRFEGV
jgi:hypothetical protein